MKKSIAVILTIILAFSMALPTFAKSKSAATPKCYEPYKDLVTFTTARGVVDNKLPAGTTMEDNFFTKFIEKKANIKWSYSWTVAGDNNGYTNKLNLAIASNDIPDIFQCDINQLKRLTDAGMIQDLTKVYQDYASPTLKGYHYLAGNRALKLATFNGKLMALPNLTAVEDAVPILWIRQDWLDKLGLKAPKTVDQLVNVLTQFVQKDPGGNGKGKTIGLTGVTQYYNNSMHGFDGIFNAFRSYPGMYIKDSKGNIVYGSIQPETKKALAKLAEMYKAGLIDKEWALQDTGKSNDLLVNGTSGTMFHAWWGPYWPLGDTIKNNPNAKWTAVTIDAADGKFYPRGNPVCDSFVVVRKGYAHPEALMKLASWMEDIDLKRIPETTQQLMTTYKDTTYGAYWPFITTAKYTDEISRQWKAVSAVLDGKKSPSTLIGEAQNIYAAKVNPYKVDPVKNVGNRNDYLAWSLGAGALVKSNYHMVFNEWMGTTPTQAAKKSALDDLEKNTFIQIIMGKAPISQFDKFVTQWKQMGGDQIMKEINAAVK